MAEKMSENNTDLHTHSIYSDGVLHPKEVVREAKEKGILNLALTDHNSIDGIEEAISEGKKIGINIIPGIEIRAKEDEVLGYFIYYKNPDLKKEIKKLQGVHIKINKIVIKEINKKGIKISYKDVLKEYYPNVDLMEIHIIRYLNKSGYGEVKDLWKEYMAPLWKGPLYSDVVSVVDAIKLIKKYGGIPVLAHPWAEPCSKVLLSEEKFKELVDAGLQGIEIDNGDRDERRDDKTLEKINALAAKYKLVVTSGSDFHGDKKSRELGIHQISMHNCNDKTIKELKSRLIK
jgi:predicted metal-dependent phosphoesterase TrpH